MKLLQLLESINKRQS